MEPATSVLAIESMVLSGYWAVPRNPMRTALILVLAILSQNAFAANKEGPCNAYLASVQANDDQSTQLIHIVTAMNASFESNYSPEQSQHLLQSFKNIIAQDASRFDAISNAAYFGCMTELTADDKAQFQTIIGHLTH
jgi:hypothetical protein